MKEDNTLPREYYRLISENPILKPHEEVHLFSKITGLHGRLSETADQSEKASIQKDIITCKHKIISANMRLVISIAKGFINRGVSTCDLVDEGTVGLIEAAERFDCTKGFRFATYATWWIRQAIVKALGNQGSSLRLPTHAIHTLKKQSIAYSDLAQEYGREPELSEISSRLRIPEEKLRGLMTVAQRACSLDEALEDAGADSHQSLVDEKTSHETQRVLDKEIIYKTLRNAFYRLSDKEIEVLRLRYGLNNSPRLTLEETCRELGITRERVRQIQKKALEKMRSTKEFQNWKM